MKQKYLVQVNDYMSPVVVNLTEDEAKTIVYVLKEIAKEDKKALVGIENEDGEIFYSNYDEWYKAGYDKED